MSNKHILYTLIIVDILLTILGGALTNVDPSIDIGLVPVLFISSLSLIGLSFYIPGIIGLFRLKNWGRICYYISFVFALLTYIPVFVYIPSLIVNNLGFTMVSFVFAIILLLAVFFGPLSKEFGK